MLHVLAVSAPKTLSRALFWLKFVATTKLRTDTAILVHDAAVCIFDGVRKLHVTGLRCGQSAALLSPLEGFVQAHG